MGLGTWQVFDVAGDAEELAQAKETLRVFVEGGGRVVDSSPMYGSSEQVTGQLAAELGVQPKLFVATKVWTSGKQAGIRQMEESHSKAACEPPRPDAGAQPGGRADAPGHAARTGRRPGASATSASPTTTRARTATWSSSSRKGDIDFVQVNYSLAEPEAERRLLGAAAEAGTAVIVNRPFAEGAMFRRVRDRALPEWAKEAGAASWAQFFLKWIVAQPAVTCVIPGTRNPRHVADNLGALSGPLPDAALRRRMAEHFNSL